VNSPLEAKCLDTQSEGFSLCI